MPAVRSLLCMLRGRIVSFYPNESSGSTDTFTRSRFTFDSWWFTSSDAYMPTLKTDRAQIKNWNSQNHGYVNLFAQWKAGEISYQIAFDGNGADSGSMKNLQMTYGETKEQPANGFDRTNYHFTSWAVYADKEKVKNFSKINAYSIVWWKWSRCWKYGESAHDLWYSCRAAGEVVNSLTVEDEITLYACGWIKNRRSSRIRMEISSQKMK